MKKIKILLLMSIFVFIGCKEADRIWVVKQQAIDACIRAGGIPITSSYNRVTDCILPHEPCCEED
ncbi:MAG: hypothetical protein HOG49_33505 [Candidatus Scalindua sp.]|jgi:hypothetical protein|nr:hypothetical protein [Candidatus Scalindua sp.]